MAVLDARSVERQHGAVSQVPDAPYPPPADPSGPSGSSDAPPAPGPAPQPVRTAVTLAWVLLGLGVVGLVVSLATANREVLQQPVPGQPALSPEVLAGIRALAVVAAGVGVLLGSVLYAVMAVQLGAGRTWPRTVLIVFAGLSAVGLVITVGQAVIRATHGPSVLAATPVEPLSEVLGVVGLGVEVAAVVLLLRPPSRAWLGAWKAVRADAKRRRVAW